LPAAYQKLLLDAVPDAITTMLAAYREADVKNLPMFKAKLTEIVYSEADLKELQDKVAKPTWDKWVETNQPKFDAKGVLDTLLKEIQKAKSTN
jgi:TRAP-type C4-dicarboxylate transport system substrate-binding protein